MKNKIVSIIVPCYNCAPYISETLDSVLASSYSLWECIVVDDGSTDASSQIVSEYVTKDSRFKLIEQKNAGVSTARNNGIEAAKGEYILPLDADDLIASTYIEKAVNVLESDDSVKLVYCKDEEHSKYAVMCVNSHTDEFARFTRNLFFLVFSYIFVIGCLK